MNSRSKLDISKSSLLSLKAEIARKHEEVTKAKAQAQGNHIKPIAKPTKSSIFSRVNSGIEQRQQKDIPDLTSDEESKILRSRSVLEEKAKIYENLSKQSSSDGQSEYLVNFAQKSQDLRGRNSSSVGNLSSDDEEERRRREKEEEEEEARIADSDEYDAPSDPEDDWVDFTDSLGRTRRCLRRDLPRFRELDDRFLRSLEPKKPIEREEKHSSVPVPPGGLPAGCAAPDLLSDDMRREQQRLKWEEQEEKLRDKTDIHYQDVLFDEARTHGVAYFPFAKEASTRRTQQEELKKLRKETESKQKAALTQREKRQQLLRARLRAAHNRKRAREGLPPLGEDEELPGDKVEEPEEEPEPAPAPTVQRGKGPRPRPSPAVRPWDIGKDGVSVPAMSQEEWNEKQRTQRKQEFAPPSFYEDREGSRAGRRQDRDEHRDERRRKRKQADDEDREHRASESPPPGPAAPVSPPPGPAPPPCPPPAGPGPWPAGMPFVPPPLHLPPPSMAWPPQPVPPPSGFVPDVPLPPPAPSGGLYFTTKKPKRQEVRLPMQEVEDFTEEGEPPPPGETELPPRSWTRPKSKQGGSDAGRVGAEIAPPPTLEYFGPSDAAADRSRRQAPGSHLAEDLSSSISAGLRYLRQQAEEKERKRTDKGWADFV